MAFGQGAFDPDSLASIGTTLLTGCFSLGLLYTIYPSVKKILINLAHRSPHTIPEQRTMNQGSVIRVRVRGLGGYLELLRVSSQSHLFRSSIFDKSALFGNFLHLPSSHYHANQSMISFSLFLIVILSAFLLLNSIQ